MVVGSLTKYLLYGLVGAFAIISLVDPQRAYGATQAFSAAGGTLGSWGTGIQKLLTGIGTGGASLLNPLWTLKDLIYAPQAGTQIPTDIREISSVSNPYLDIEPNIIKRIERDPRSYPQGEDPIFDRPTGPPFEFHVRRGFGATPVALATVSTWLPGQEALPLSQSAIDYYESIGATVSPSSNQTVATTNSQNATSASAASVTTGGISGVVGSSFVSTTGGSEAASAAAASLRAAAAAL